MDEAGYERGRGGGGGVDVGCFGCLRAQRTLPPPRSSAKSASGPVLPVLIWRDGGLAGRAAAKAAALEDAIGTPSGDAGPPIPGAAAVNQLHVLVRELQAAWRHKHLQSAGAIYSPPEGTAHEDDEAGRMARARDAAPNCPRPSLVRRRRPSASMSCCYASPSCCECARPSEASHQRTPTLAPLPIGTEWGMRRPRRSFQRWRQPWPKRHSRGSRLWLSV